MSNIDPLDQYADVPETKSLLPPLPDTEKEVTCPITTATTSPTCFPKSMDTSKAVKGLQIWKEDIFLEGTTEISASKTNSPTVRSRQPSVIMPEQSSRQTSTVAQDKTMFSPTIPITAKFGVSVFEPDIEATTDGCPPGNDKERVQQYEDIQKLQDDEFAKTCKTLQSSGWMSRSELEKLERAKQDNWARWEDKIRETRRGSDNSC